MVVLLCQNVYIQTQKSTFWEQNRSKTGFHFLPRSILPTQESTWSRKKKHRAFFFLQRQQYRFVMKRTGSETLLVATADPTLNTDELRSSKKQEIEASLGEEHHFDTNTTHPVLPNIAQRYMLLYLLSRFQCVDKWHLVQTAVPTKHCQPQPILGRGTYLGTW